MTEYDMAIIIGLFIILIAVFVLPLLLKRIAQELEIFLFIMGILAVINSQLWSLDLIINALTTPIIITVIVFIAGILFKFLQEPLANRINKIVSKIGLKSFIFLIIVVLGLLSSVITAITAALVLVVIVNALNLERKSGIKLVVLACFSIGLGAVLTPIGEPLSTIVISKLGVGFWFLFNNLAPYIIPFIFFIGLLSIIMVGGAEPENCEIIKCEVEDMKGVLLRTAKIYLFIMALTFLGAGFIPLIDMYFLNAPSYLLYWMNTVSAVLDNATLAAAEIGPLMSLVQINAALLGLIIAGGMLVPGNIPNIIAANKLKITNREWAKIGLPLCFALMVVYFGLIVIFMI